MNDAFSPEWLVSGMAQERKERKNRSSVELIAFNNVNCIQVGLLYAENKKLALKGRKPQVTRTRATVFQLRNEQLNQSYSRRRWTAYAPNDPICTFKVQNQHKPQGLSIKRAIMPGFSPKLAQFAQYLVQFSKRLWSVCPFFSAA